MNFEPDHLYRLFTEDNENLSELVSHVFGNFTILRGEGCYNGDPENSVCIEICTTNEDGITYVVETIKKVNRQECVLVQRFGCASCLA
jgi:hypothetical protein